MIVHILTKTTIEGGIPSTVVLEVFEGDADAMRTAERDAGGKLTWSYLARGMWAVGERNLCAYRIESHHVVDHGQ